MASYYETNYFRRDWNDYEKPKEKWEAIATPDGIPVHVSPDGKVHARGFVDTNDNIELYLEDGEIKTRLRTVEANKIITVKSTALHQHSFTAYESLFSCFQYYSNATHMYDTKALPLPHKKYSLLNHKTKKDIVSLTSSQNEVRNFHYEYFNGTDRHVEPYIEGSWIGPFNYDVHLRPHEMVKNVYDLLVIKSAGFNTMEKTPTPHSVSAVTFTTGASGYVYVETTSIPKHGYGPFLGFNTPTLDPTIRRYKFKNSGNALLGEDLTPTQIESGDIIGVFKNGVFIHSPHDGLSFGGSGFWNGNSVVSEEPHYDFCGGKIQTLESSSDEGGYHYRGMPLCEEEGYGSASNHSAIVGYAKDGFPIYGPYGYSNPQDNASALKRIEPSYRLKNVSTRIHPSGNGPAFTGIDDNGVTFKSGYFLEDYEYVAGLGDLDEHNGRSGVTPEFPNGTYAYFATVDQYHAPVYPYFIGTGYHGNLHDLSEQGLHGEVAEAPLYLRLWSSTPESYGWPIGLWDVYGHTAEGRKRVGLASEKIIWVSPHVVKDTQGVFLKTGYQQHLKNTGVWDYNLNTGSGMATYLGNRRMATGNGDFLAHAAEYSYPTSDGMQFKEPSIFSGGMQFAYYDQDTAAVINSITPLSVTGSNFYKMYSGHRKVSGRFDDRLWHGKIPAGTAVKFETWSFNGFQNGFDGKIKVTPCYPHPLTSGNIIVLSAQVTGMGETKDQAYVEAKKIARAEMLKLNDTLLVKSGIKDENTKMKSWRRLKGATLRGSSI